jgi:hypothetical protein
MATTIAYRFVVKRDLAANFTAANTLLLQGEFALETDTLKMKMGDGVTPWTSLAYYYIPGASVSSSSSGGSGSAGRDGEEGRRGPRGRQGFQGIQGVTGTAGPSSPQQPPGAAWANYAQGVPITLPVNAAPRLITGSYNIQECVVLTQNGPGSCVIKVWKLNLGTGYPPTSANDITGGNNVVLSSTNTHRDSTLTGWSTGLVQDDVLLFSLSECSIFSLVQIQLRIA